MYLILIANKTNKQTFSRSQILHGCHLVVRPLYHHNLSFRCEDPTPHETATDRCRSPEYQHISSKYALKTSKAASQMQIHTCRKHTQRLVSRCCILYSVNNITGVHDRIDTLVAVAYNVQVRRTTAQVLHSKAFPMPSRKFFEMYIWYVCYMLHVVNRVGG
jgi:hypothetical protein